MQKLTFFKCATIVALYGTLIRFITNVAMENWKTQLAATNLSDGICIWLLRNHTPIHSAINTTIPLKANCTETAVENTF